jgi:hypothetical protein
LYSLLFSFDFVAFSNISIQKFEKKKEEKKEKEKKEKRNKENNLSNPEHKEKLHFSRIN